jgi:hypothetical protein
VDCESVHQALRVRGSRALSALAFGATRRLLRRFSVVLRSLAAALALSFVVPVAAPAATITTTTGDSKLSALGGWLVWSEPDGDAWRLVALKDGVRRTFDVPARGQPFDVDLGTDARGRVVATYTRCTTYA